MYNMYIEAKSMPPLIDSKTVPLARSPLATPLLIDWPRTHARGMGHSSRVPCQHRTLKQGSTSEKYPQTQLISRLSNTENAAGWKCQYKTPSSPPHPPAFNS